ncbi:protein TIME FOR COFFEE isoform X2 [Eutrema salsugineum]|uniref:protein TIME FOR COFFEE isoform X2 n=1 Tax=Eutrema salsugineum TaxID=72664 RepID=UPI000CED3E74|nr:protein TIME FOR COFFEE isoform X2 [Eutrema salsugineum]
MDKTREARRSSTTMAALKRRQRISDNSRGRVHQEVVTVRDRPEKKERDPESLNRSKRRRSERFAPRSERAVEEDSSDESLGDGDSHRKSFPSGRIPRHAASLKVADGMIGVPVPRKARSACIKRSHDCRTSSGSGGGGYGEDRRRPPTSPGSCSFEVVSPSSSTVSAKQKKNVNGHKSRIPKPPKSSGTIEEDLEIEIAEVLSGLKKLPSKREDDSEGAVKSSEVKGANKLKTEGEDSSAGLEMGGLISCKATRIETANNERETTSLASDIQQEREARQETPGRLDGVLDSAVSKGVSVGPQLENCNSKLEIDLMVPPTTPSPQKLSLLPLVSDSVVIKASCKLDTSVESKEKTIVEKRQWLNLDVERLSQETGRDSSLGLQNLDWSQPQQAKYAQQSSISPLTVAVGGWPSRLPPQGYDPLIHNGKPVDGSNGSFTLVEGAPFLASQPSPKRCATHFFIARNIQLHQHFVKTNHLSQPNKASVYLKGGGDDLRPSTGNPSLVGRSPSLSLNSQAQDRTAVNVSALKDKTSESGHFASTRQKKPQLSPASSSIVPAQAYIFPTNQHLQPVIVPSKSPRPAKNPCLAVGSASVSFNLPSSSASEASSPYFTVHPNNAYSFQLSSTIRGGTASQALPFFNGSFYSPQMFQPPQLLQKKQSQGQRETKATSCSSSSHRQPHPQVTMNSLSNQASVQKHRQQSQKSEAKAAGNNSDSRGSSTQKGGPYSQIMTAPMQPQNFSMSFASFAGGSAPANLNFTSNGYQIVSAPPVVHQINHQASDSKRGGGSCSSNFEDPKRTLTGKPPSMMNGQTLVFDNPSRTLNFVSGAWPPAAATTINGDPSAFSQHLTQKQQQSGRSKTMTHSQADTVPAMSSQWKNPATSSPTSYNSLNLKQFQSPQQIRTHGQTQISFAAPSKSQPSQGKQGRSGGSSSSVTGFESHGKAASPKVDNSKALPPLSPLPSSSADAHDQTENSASGSAQKTSPVCGRNVPPIITSCPGHLSNLKY